MGQVLDQEDGHLKLRRAIRRLAWPAILEMGLHMLVGVVDTAMVGRLGAEEIAGVALGSNVVFSVIFVFAAIGIGAAAMVSRFIGAQDQQQADKVAAQALVMALVLGVTMAMAGHLFSASIFSLSRTESAVQQIATSYLRIVSVSTLLMLPQFVGNAMLRAAGDTRTPLVLAAFANVLNIVGDYVLIFGWGRIPALGVTGAALATTGAQLIGALVNLLLIFSGKLALKISPTQLRVWDFDLIKRIFRLSAPAALEELSFTINGLAMFFLIGRLGTISLAAHQVAMTVESVSFMPGHGFAIAASTLAGQHLGAKDHEGAMNSGWLTLRYSLTTMGLMGLIFFLVPRFLACLFSNNTDVVGLASMCIRIAALQQVPVAIEQVLAGCLRGAGDTRYPFYVSSLGIWILRLPLVAAAVLFFGWPIWSIWMISAFGWFVRAALLMARFRGRQWIAVKV